MHQLYPWNKCQSSLKGAQSEDACRPEDKSKCANISICGLSSVVLSNRKYFCFKFELLQAQTMLVYSLPMKNRKWLAHDINVHFCYTCQLCSCHHRHRLPDTTRQHSQPYLKKKDKKKDLQTSVYNKVSHSVIHWLKLLSLICIPLLSICPVIYPIYPAWGPL